MKLILEARRGANQRPSGHGNDRSGSLFHGLRPLGIVRQTLVIDAGSDNEL
jgi:hypothetical protein